RRDKETELLWGIRDFEYRFGRAPEGMWLPEAAVNLETLEVLAEHGIRFTVLSPHQAARVRRRDEPAWRPVGGGGIATRLASVRRLPAGRTASMCFCDGPRGGAVAPGDLLAQREEFVARLLGGVDDGDDGPQLVHLATDGERYGHHHRHGDRAL